MNTDELTYNKMNKTTTKITESQVFTILHPRDDDTHKGSYGQLMCVCGCSSYVGAAALAVTAALRCGAGIVRLASTDVVANIVAAKVSEPIFTRLPSDSSGGIDGDAAIQSPELAAALNSATACLIGCGLSKSASLRRLVEWTLQNADCRLLIDADGLNLLAETNRVGEILRSAKNPPIITPHLGEMSRLCGLSVGEIKSAKVDVARRFAAEWNAVVVLKDHVTVVASPDGRVFENTTGNAGLARGGSGDTLSGMTAAFLAQGIDALDAALCGVWLHGAAADRCAERLSKYGMLPSDILADLCAIFVEHGL